MPLGMHKMAQPAAKAALAAHEQGKFWEFHDQLFAQKKITKESFKQIATALELDLTQFEKDMTSPKIMVQLQKDLSDAKKAGVTGTPTIFINGRKPKQRNLRGFQAIIDDELSKKGVK